MYSVIPGYFLFKKFFFEIGPFKNLYVFRDFNKLSPTEKDFLIKLFDCDEIFLILGLNLYSKLIKLLVLLFYLVFFMFL